MTKRAFVSTELPIIVLEGVVKMIKAAKEDKIDLDTLIKDIEKTIIDLKEVRDIQLNEEHIEY